ncbi:MAG: tRNA (adenosine(37)-N6)-dimethylallyltransferase MiaA [Bacteroidales bacterium]|nr:tRNA (adenosine(37)-N6)-dimethylallyltransferase MiaA [Bacteroidales bacterium]
MASNSIKTLIVIAGPTACGKTALSVEIAKHLKTEILSADSRQFYHEMKIGTAAPDIEEQDGIKHHFIGHLSIHDDYNVSRYENDALACLKIIFQQSDFAICTGGSGLYIRALCNGIDNFPDIDPTLRESLNEQFKTQGIESLRQQLKLLDPDYYHEVDLANPMRLLRALEVCYTTGQAYSQQRTTPKHSRPFNILKIVINRPREELFNRINLRTNKMIDDGFLQEAESLFEFRQLNALNTVGYKELFAHLGNQMSLMDAVEKIKTNTRRYAKRQLTWFTREDDYHWYNADDKDEIIKFIESNTTYV